MLDPSIADITSWAAPTVAIVVGSAVTAVAAAVFGLAKDRRKAADQAAEDEKRQRDELDRGLAKQVAAITGQVTEMHVALLGEDSTPWNMNPRPGLVKQVARIEGTLFGNGGVNNTVLDRLQRIEAGRTPSEEDTDRPDELAERKHQ